jgi:hypothetical protein
MNYTKWTEKSRDVPFVSSKSKSGIGPGEEKLSSELGIPINGQNSPFDMSIVLNGVETKVDIKKLDTQDDFNTGKDGRDALRPIKTKITGIIHLSEHFADSNVFTQEEQETLIDIQNRSPDEFSVGTTHKFTECLNILSSKKKALESSLPDIMIPITVDDEPKDVSIPCYYDILKKLGKKIRPDLHPYIDTLETLQKMDHPYIDNPDNFKEDIDSLVGKLFTKTKIIIVHEQNGYIILEDISRIKFLRITRGNPRFKVIF